MKMTIISVSQRTLIEVAKSIITIEEEIFLVRRRNMATYHQNFDSDESNESNDEEQVK